MGLLDLYSKNGTLLNSKANQPPTTYNTAGTLNNASLIGSSLDLDGVTPISYNQVSALDNVKPGYSGLDLDSKTPSKYTDNLPQ